MTMQNKSHLQPFLAGLLVGGLLMYWVAPLVSESQWWPWSNPAAHTPSDAYHTHADFLVVVDGEIVDLSGDEYMTTVRQSPHPHAHLHDNNGAILHYHAPDITLVEFLASLGVSLTDSCFSGSEDTERCQSETEAVVLYVNDELYPAPYSEYVPGDLDRILLYVGNPDAAAQAQFLTQVGDEACIYSGSCPERGVAPPESCGLTCEL